MKRTSRKAKLFWERAYKGHAYWLGKAKLGRVTLTGRNHYRWQAAGKAGEAEDLEQAKKAVELAVAMADKQMDLFQ